jgi:glycine hydroxymethyltransferase
LSSPQNFASRAVLEAMGSVLTNKYSEGYPGARYYGGNEFIDQNESLCIKRALAAFRLSPEKWGVNVQALSGSPANFATYNAILEPHDRVMGLALASGGHLTHGFMTPQGKRISATSKYWESMSYTVDPITGLIDYDGLELLANNFRPKLIIAGFSAYPRHYDYARMRKICDNVGAYLMADMAHISGLVAANLIPNPFDYADVVTSTTHKTLRGPRAGLIWYRRGVRSTSEKGKEVLYDLDERINTSVFPGLQGGPHNHAIAAISVALHESMQPAFVSYQKQVLANAKVLASELSKLGFTLTTGGTDNHLMVVNLKKSRGIDGARVEKVLEKCLITVNKNTVPGDDKPFVPSGVRIGTPALTTRGFKEKDFAQVAQLLSRGVDIANAINKEPGAEAKVVTFAEALNAKQWPAITKLREEVSAFASKFHMPGQDDL